MKNSRGRFFLFVRSLSILAVLTTLTSCTTPIESRVTRFHALGAPNQTVPYRFYFAPKEGQRNNLEYASYCDQITFFLAKAGWVREKDPKSAAYVVEFYYGIDNGKTVTGAVPIFGQTGGGTSTSTGTSNTSQGTTARYKTTTYSTPTFGEVAAIPYSSTEYRRELILNIKMANALSEELSLFEGRVVSIGSTPEVAVVMPYMIESLFKDFPGKSGSSSLVSLPFKD